MGLPVAASTRTSIFLDSRRAQPADLALLQHPEQLGLERLRQIGDFVEQQCAAVGQLEEAGMVRSGAGEGALGVTEQLGLEQLLRDGGAVDAGKAAFGPGAHPVDGAGDDFLSGPTLAGDQHRGIVAGDPGGQLDHVTHGAAL